MKIVRRVLDIFILFILGMCFVQGSFASSPHDMFIKRDGIIEHLGPYYQGNFCDGSLPIMDGKVEVFDRYVPDDPYRKGVHAKPGPDSQMKTIFPCKDGRIHGVAEFKCDSYSGYETYMNGVRHGESKFFDEKGECFHRSTYDNGALREETNECH